MKWILVEERLPPQDQIIDGELSWLSDFVLVVLQLPNGEREIDIGWYNYYTNDWELVWDLYGIRPYDFDSYDEKIRITHWMPMPDLPEE